ncbi:acriflavin resistance protein [Halovibrio salipaludis]|uniref:Acriflavin resistance protein n=1 Tax=Halovibrio salipaludis TaxID=2032626 RepID=A0A2A2F829_9GAMM|nr:efflux RND transporter permease subunit [Halovibrio salipaludis]PAU81711.1 acriflavin resistance protein [Halovibrio salipaludis]
MIRWFAAHPTAGNLLLILILAVGLFSAPNLKRETFPDYRPPEVSISMEYRGATAADVEEAICQRFNDALQRVDNMEELSCTARDNMAQAVASMERGGDMGRFLDDIRTAIEALQDLPERAEDPIIEQRHRTDLVAALAVSGPMSFNDLETYVDDLEDRLLRLDGVADVVTQGLSQRQWQVAVSRDQLRQYGLAATDIAAALQRQNLDLPLGTLETERQDVQLRFVDQRRRAEDLNNIRVISGQSGAEIRLGEIADVSIDHERAEERVLFNGERAIILEVHKNLSADSLRVMDALQDFRQQELEARNGTVNLELTQDMTSIVRDRLQMLVENGIFGLILVGLVLSLFFRPRLALWALFGLPAAFAGAFAVMLATGLTLNMVTLVALLMAIGIVMDDAVVITDNIAASASPDRSTLEAATQGARQVLPGVMSSFLTTASIFLPLSFLAGEMGAVLEVLPVALLAALAASLVEAFWILPHHLKGSLRSLKSATQSRFRAGFTRRFEALREHSGRLADRAIKARYTALALMLLFLFGSVGAISYGMIKMEGMPDIDGDVLEARILMPQGTPLARTKAVADRVSGAMESIGQDLTPEQPGEQPLVENIQTRFNHHASAGETGPHIATVMVDLLTAERRTTDLATLTERWYEAIGPVDGLVSLNIQEPGFGPAGIPIEIRLHHEDLSTLKQAATDLSTAIGDYTGTLNIMDDLRPGRPQRQLSLKEGALALGIDARDVANQVRTGVLGDIVDSVQVGDQYIEVLLRQTDTERNTLDFLEDSVVFSANDRPVPLTEVAHIETARDWGQITRIDGLRTATVTADVDTRTANAGAIVGELGGTTFAELKDRYPGLGITVEGQTARSKETGQSIARGLLIGLLGIFLILSFQFRSYIEPLIVMLAIPVAFMGAIWGHILMGYNLTTPSLVGAASLSGIVVNNAILLVQFIRIHRESGLDALSAARQASRDRFRAIFITSSTTIAGLLPLLAETSTQAMAIKPLVISVVFGLLISTVLILIALPAFYIILNDLKLTATEAESSP